MLHTAYAYPTSVTYGSFDSGATNGTATATAGGTAKITMHHSGPLANWGWYAMWQGFTAPTLPADAVVSGIYGVITCARSHTGYGAIPGAFFGTAGDPTAVNPGSETPAYSTAGIPNSDFASTQFTTSSLGTDPTVIASQKPFARLFQTASADFVDELDVLSIAYQIRYESAAVIVIPHGVNCHDYDNGGPLDPTFPPGNGLLIGDLTPLNDWCHANDIHVAPKLDTQRSAIEILKDLLVVGNSAAVYSGDMLKIIPLDEVSKCGWGAVYIAPTASGPIIDLADEDFIDGQSPVLVERDSPINCDNVTAVEYTDRTIDYQSNTGTGIDQMAVALYGTRKGGQLDSSSEGLDKPKGAKSMPMIADPHVAQAIASILVKVAAANVPVYKFGLKAEKFALEAMDLVTITDTRIGFTKRAVRLRSVKENDDKTLACEAERYIYGLHHPDVKTPMLATGSLSSNNVDPGVVNDPIIFEPNQAMLGSGAASQLWIVVSGVDGNYGGCVAFLSIDGGASYPITLGNVPQCTTGELMADFPAGSDPDTTHTLSVDLSESNGDLSTNAQVTADAFGNPCYVDSLTSPMTAAYEVICPTVATVTALNEYDLGTYIRRGVDTTAIADHPTGSRFAVLDGSVLKVDIDPSWIGRTLYFKFAAYNLQFGNQNALPDCTPYTYTPTGNAAFPTFLVNGA